jgi:hypothetical protein
VFDGRLQRAAGFEVIQIDARADHANNETLLEPADDVCRARRSGQQIERLRPLRFGVRTDRHQNKAERLFEALGLLLLPEECVLKQCLIEQTLASGGAPRAPGSWSGMRGWWTLG